MAATTIFMDLPGFAEQPEKFIPVRGIEKDLALFDAALDDVIDGSGCEKSLFSWHGGIEFSLCVAKKSKRFYVLHYTCQSRFHPMRCRIVET